MPLLFDTGFELVYDMGPVFGPALVGVKQRFPDPGRGRLSWFGPREHVH
jgi:hypothetical protein